MARALVAHPFEANLTRQYTWWGLTALLVIILLVGCGAAPTQYAPGYKAAFEKKHGGDEAKARTFLEAISSLPPGERKAYIRSHWADTRNLSLIPDQDLQKRYRDLVTGQL
jgi:hypothetical protein